MLHSSLWPVDRNLPLLTAIPHIPGSFTGAYRIPAPCNFSVSVSWHSRRGLPGACHLVSHHRHKAVTWFVSSPAPLLLATSEVPKHSVCMPSRSEVAAHSSTQLLGLQTPMSSSAQKGGDCLSSQHRITQTCKQPCCACKCYRGGRRGSMV